MCIWIPTGLYIKLKYLNKGVQEEDSWLNCTVEYKHYNNHTQRVWLQILSALE